MSETSFDKRFRAVVAKMRTNRVMTILAWTGASMVTGLLALAATDYFFEMGWLFRAAVFLLGVTAAIAIAGWFAVAALRYWNRRATAAKVEDRFLDLGQSVRTSVQFNDEPAQQPGVSPRLLEALREDVQERTEDLRLSEAVSSGSLKIATLLLGGLAALAVFAVASSWDWRMAVTRALLGNSPYTSITVHQGDTRVDEKESLTLTTDISGRTNREIKLLTRELPLEELSSQELSSQELPTKERSDGQNDPDTSKTTSAQNAESQALPEWTTRLLGSDDETKRETRFVSYELEIPKIKRPFEYQIVAGKYVSPVHRVDVRYPLAIKQFDITVTPPEYTGRDPKTFNSGSFDGVEGSFAELNIKLDHPPEKAWLELRPFMTPPGEDPEIETVALEVNGTQLSTELELLHDRIYQVFAKASDGTELRPNRFRIRVHEDRPPKLTFRKPDQLIEVHALAEVLMRLKVTDDYGLTRVGIRLQKNNEDEVEFEDLEIEDLITEDGRIRPQTQAQLERIVPLEYFDELELRDSISFYAYAEDNHPDGAQRNETDLHFIDIRPFRRKFRMPEPGQGLNGMGNNNGSGRPRLPTLNQMIDRERFVVNRTRQFHRREDQGKTVDPNSVDGLIGFQNETSETTGLLGDAAVEAEVRLGIPEEGRISDLFYAAQSDMLASIDSLSNLEWEIGELQEKDALQHLLDARTQLEEIVSQNRGGGGNAFQSAFQRLRQRLRRPKSDRERAREVVRRLKQAASEQEFLMEKISDLVPPEMPEQEEDENENDESETDESETDEPDTESVTDTAEDLDDGDTDAQEEDQDEDSFEEMRRQLEEEQLELSEEVHEIAEMIQKLNQLTPLAQRRTQRATNNVDSVVGAIERFDSEAATQMANSTSQLLRELANNINGTTADEATARLAVARDLGLLLTDDLRQLKDSLADARRQSAESELDADAAAEQELQLSRPLSQQSQVNAETARTIQDILNSIVDPETGIPDSEDLMVKRLQEITVETKLSESVERLQKLPETIDSLEWSESGVQADDLADRFDIVSQRLDSMHREILAPRVEQLRKLEKRAVEARNQLTEFQTKDQVDRWHIRANGLLNDIKNAEVAEKQVDGVRASIEASGWSTGATNSEGAASNWKSTDDGFTPPDSYGASLDELVSEIQRYIRELSMVNMDIINTGAIPPKYKQFVERYFEVMSGSTK